MASCIFRIVFDQFTFDDRLVNFRRTYHSIGTGQILVSTPGQGKLLATPAGCSVLPAAAESSAAKTTAKIVLRRLRLLLAGRLVVAQTTGDDLSGALSYDSPRCFGDVEGAS